MDIRPTSNNFIPEWSRSINGSRQVTPGSTYGTTPGADFSRTQSLRDALANAPEVRPEKVQEARELIADPDFPSDQDIDQISRLMAGYLTNDDIEG
jgi:hypothetical protein